MLGTTAVCGNRYAQKNDALNPQFPRHVCEYDSIPRRFFGDPTPRGKGTLPCRENVLA